ncbi:MAG: universal stress protein [Actinomycetes bacterium]|jgi:nucleotide-binding universal stress UspA family protein
MATVLVAVDASKASRKVAEVAGHWAYVAGDDVVLLHARLDYVTTRGDLGSVEDSWAASVVADELAAIVRLQGVAQVTTRIDVALNGEIARAILDVAHEVDAELVVLGHRTTTLLAGLLAGSTAHKVVNLSDRPVLVVR